MITTVTLAQGAIRMAREKVIVKHLSAIQNLGSIDILCSDKTGTLTAGTMSLDASLDPFGRASDRALFLAHAEQPRSRRGSGARSTPRSSSDPWPGPTGSPRPTRSRSTSSGAGCRSWWRSDGRFLLVTRARPRACSAPARRYELDGGVHALDDAATRALPGDVPRRERARLPRARGGVPARVASARASTHRDERELTLVGFLTFADHRARGRRRVDRAAARRRRRQ